MTVYEQIKEFLISEGCKFDDENNIFSKSMQTKQQSVMIVNGQRMEQPPKYTDIEIEYFGEGSIDDTPLAEYNIFVNGGFVGTILVDSLEDFKKEIYNNF